MLLVEQNEATCGTLVYFSSRESRKEFQLCFVLVGPTVG